MTTPQPNKKKVLYVITKSNWGGAQRYVYDLATNLNRTQFEPVVALGGNGTLSDMLTHAGIRVIPLFELKNTTTRATTRAAVAELYQIVKSERPDILHVNSSVAGLIGAYVGKRARVPRVIFTAHGWAFNEDREWKVRLLFKALHYLTVMLSDRTIAVSRAIVNQMNWPGAMGRMKVVNPGRSIGVMYERADARNKIIDTTPSLASYHDDTWVVTIAELHPIKRLNLLILAMAEMCKTNPTLRLIIIGDGREKERLANQIIDLGLETNVHLIGSITEAARFLKAFDLFVLPSKSESYGYVLHEAGLAHVPVIATNVGGIPDIVTNGKTGILVPPDSVSSLTDAIRRLTTSANLATLYSDALYTEMSSRTVARMVTQTESLYNE